MIPANARRQANAISHFGTLQKDEVLSSSIGVFFTSYYKKCESKSIFNN
jgi:hypothetical protein